MITHNDVSKWLDDKGFVSTTVAAEMTGREPGGHIKDLMVGNNVRSVKVTIDAQGDFPVSRTYWYIPDIISKVPILNAKPLLVHYSPVDLRSVSVEERKRITAAWSEDVNNVAWYDPTRKQWNSCGALTNCLCFVIKSDFDLTGTGLEQCNVTAN